MTSVASIITSMGHRLLACLAALSIFSSMAFANEVICDTLETCAEETKLLLAQNPNPNYGAEYQPIIAAFSQFERDGFDVLFQLMMGAESEDQEFLLSTVRSMMPSKGETGFELSDDQTEYLIRLWNAAPTYKLTGMINSVDTPRTHAVLIEALKGQDEDKREWAERVIHRFGVGSSESSVAGEYLDDILSIIESRNSLAALSVLNRIDTPDAQDALWSLLQSKNRLIFQNTFETLKKRDKQNLYPAIRDLKFEDTEEDEARAVMIAQVIAQKRRKIWPTKRSLEYWKNWVASTDLETTESLIPVYLFMNFHQKLADQVARSEKTISDFSEYLEHTLENPAGRPDHLSEAALTKKIEAEIARLESLPALLESSTQVLIANEALTAREYFRIFKIVTVEPDNYGFHFYRLPFPAVLDAAIETEPMWTQAFANQLDCGPAAESLALITQLAELDPDNARLKTCLKERLTYLDNMPMLVETLAFISRNDGLRVDRDLHKAVSDIDENHPFSIVRLLRQQILSNAISPAIRGRGYLHRPAERKLFADINANRTYCEAGALGEFPYVEYTPGLNPTSPKFKPELTAKYFRMGAPVMTVETPSGYLTGHDRGEFGGGLMYYVDENSDPIHLHGRNMIAIIESGKPGVYWGVSGLNHLMPGQGTISRIDARTDDVSVEQHMRMPIVTNDVKLLETGDLFMDFWTRSYTSFKDGEKLATPNPSTDFNPPVLLTRGGEIKAACGN